MRAEIRTGLLGVVAVLLLTMGGCTKIENALARTKVFNFMHNSPAFDPYEAPRYGPRNSVPVASPGEKWEPVIPKTDAALRAWGDTMTNPLAMDEVVLLEGAQTFQIYCAVCHGVGAAGDGPLVGQGKLPFATNLLLPTTQERTDGYLYAIVRIGRGLMPSYARIPPSQRWAVVNYVRHLQQGGEPIPVDVPGVVQPGADTYNTATDAPAEMGQE